jgi:hypothetical protein
MSTDIAVHNPDESLPAKIEWAKTMAHASLLPKQYQGNPGNLLYAIEYADALGIDRINAITSIHVINGKPSASADLIAGLIRRAGHKLRVSGDDKEAVAQIIRADDPDFTYEARWDLAKAKAAGLNTPTWRQYPAAMLRSRAITEVARMGASDALYGLIYTSEELGATVDEDGAVVDDAPVPTGKERLQDALKSGGHVSVPDPDAPPLMNEGEDFTPDPITPKQLVGLNAAVTDLGLTREQKIAGASQIIGRTIESMKELTKDEATKVIKSLKATLAATEAAAGEVVQGELVDELPIGGDAA